MCLRIASEALANKLGFCDYKGSGDQVSFRDVINHLHMKCREIKVSRIKVLNFGSSSDFSSF